MGRRGNGEGTVFQRQDGRWVGEAYVLLPSGARRRRSVYGRTRAEAHEKVTALVRQAQLGLPAAAAGMRLDAYLASWLTEVAERSVRPRTYQLYELIVRRHLVPALGTRRLDRLTAQDVRRLLNAKTDEGLAANSVRQVHAVLRVALEEAVRQDLLARNVARLVRAPASTSPPVEPLGVEEARRLVTAAEGDRLHALWLVALALGLRKGEALGLRWSDVDLDAGLLRVNLSLQRIGGRLVLSAPKTLRSRRTVPMPAVCVEALRAHVKRQRAECQAVGEYWNESGLVFTTTIGTPIDPRNVNRWFDELCSRVGVRRIRVHDLRHTCATLLLAQGVSPRVVMETLGHSQIGMTMNTYTHVVPELQREAAVRMHDLLSGPVAVTAAVNRPDEAGPSAQQSWSTLYAPGGSNPEPSD